MVKIRLKRQGAKKAPYYRVVVADSRSPRDGRNIEELGTYDPMAKPSVIQIDLERAKYWIANGAQPTDTVRGLLKLAEAQQASVEEAPAQQEAAEQAPVEQGAAEQAE